MFLMVLTQSQYKAQIDAFSLCSKKPDPVIKKVYYDKRSEELFFELEVYPCSHNQEFRSTSSNYETEEYQSWSIQNMYALMKGTENTSIIVLGYTKSSVDGSLILTPVDFIKNVYKEFLYEIHIPL